MMSKPMGAIFGVLTLVAILAIAPSAFAQESGATVNISSGAGSGPTCSQSNNCFDPNVINVTPGTTVEWKNNDKVSHTVTSGTPSDNQTGTIFDSSLIAAGKDFSFTFNDPGTYNYFCQVHPWMTGQVIVAAASTPSTNSNSMPSSTSSSMNMSSGNSMPSSTSSSMNMSSGTTSSNAPTTESAPSSTTESTNMPSSTTTSYAPSTSDQSNSNTAPASTASSMTPTTQSSNTNPDQMTGWTAGIVVAAVMSGIGIWSAVRRR